MAQAHGEWLWVTGLALRGRSVGQAASWAQGKANWELQKHKHAGV